MNSVVLHLFLGLKSSKSCFCSWKWYANSLFFLLTNFITNNAKYIRLWNISTRWDLINKFLKEMNILHIFAYYDIKYIIRVIKHSHNKNSNLFKRHKSTNPISRSRPISNRDSITNSTETRWRGAASFWTKNVDSKQISNLKRKVSARIWPRFVRSFLGLARTPLRFFGFKKGEPNIPGDVWPRLTPKLFHF